MIVSRDQERAKKAWDNIDYVDSECQPEFKKEYRSIAMKLPTMIVTNGLGQSLAFLKSKGKGSENSANEKIYRDIEDYLLNSEDIPWDKTKGELIEKVINLPNDKFRFVTSEALSFLSWMKRFADGVLEKEEK